MLFVVPKANTTTQYLTYKEAQTLYGCGVSATRTIAGFLDAGRRLLPRRRTRERRSPSPGTSGFLKRSWCRQSAWQTAAEAASSMASRSSRTRKTRSASSRPIFRHQPHPPQPSSRSRRLDRRKRTHADSHVRCRRPQECARRSLHHLGIRALHRASDRRQPRATRAADLIGYINGTKASPSWD